MSDPAAQARNVLPEMLPELRGRRDRLRRATLALEDAASAPAAGDVTAWGAAVAARLDDFAAAFDDHVEITEGEDGLFHELVEASLEVTSAVDRLRRDHVTMQAELERARAHAAEVRDRAGIEEVRRSILQLAASVFKHRQRGSDLLYDAYSVDVSVGD